MLITPHRYTSFEDLLSDLTRNMKLPYGVRQIFTPNGSKVRDIEELKDGESYVCASFEKLKRMKYGSTSSLPNWSTGAKRKDPNSDGHLFTHVPVGLSYPTNGKYAELYGRTTFGGGHTGPGSFSYNRGNPGASLDGDSKALGILHSDRSPIKPKVVKIVKTGPRPRKVVSLLINKRSVQSYEQLIQDVSDAFGMPKYKNNRVRKLFTLKGKEVKSLVDFYRDKEGVFIASPSRTSITDDAILDIHEELFPDNPYAQFIKKRKGKRKDGGKNDSGISDEGGKSGKRDKGSRNKLGKDSDSRLNDSRGSDGTTDGSIISRKKDGKRREEEELEWKKRELEERMQEEVKRKEYELQQREEELKLKEEKLERKEQDDRDRKDREREEELAKRERELREKEQELKRRESVEGKKLQELMEADAQRNILEAKLKAQASAERDAREAAERKAAEEAAKREEAERRAQNEMDKRAREEETLKRREEAERRGRLEAEMATREKEARRASAERRARDETERRLQQEQLMKEKEEAERQAREAERLAREEAQSRALSEKQAREEAERKAEEATKYREGQEEERRKREEAERLARLEADLRREAERRAQEEADRKRDNADAPSQSNSPRDQNDNIDYKGNADDTPSPEVPKERFVRQPRTLVKKSDILLKYDIGDKIGDGNFADVHEATHKETEEMFALKIIEKAKLKNKEHMVENEIAIMKHVRHPNIVRLYEEFETRGHIYLVMEYVTGGDLFDAITESVKFTEADAALMVSDLTRALEYLHDLNVVHRDLKPENLLVNRSESGEITLKLADFGLAMEVKEPIYTVCGTPTYVAPEILAETGYGLEVDMWAIGVITYILLCGFPPFRSPDRDQEELFELIQAGEFKFVSPYWDNISSAAKDLINHLLIVSKKKRYTAKQVLRHPWITSKGAAGKETNLQREVSMNLEKNFKGRRSAKQRKAVAPQN